VPGAAMEAFGNEQLEQQPAQQLLVAPARYRRAQVLVLPISIRSQSAVKSGQEDVSLQKV